MQRHTNNNGDTPLSNYSVSVSVASIILRYAGTFTAGTYTDKNVKKAMEFVVAQTTGVMLRDTTCNVTKVTTTGTDMIQLSCVVVVPYDGVPSSVGTSEQMAKALKDKTSATFISEFNSQLTKLGSGTTTVTENSREVQYTTAFPGDPIFTCKVGGCLFRNYEENTHYSKYTKIPFASDGECGRACAMSKTCTGYEWKKDSTSCTFWHDGVCDVRSPQAVGMESRTTYKTCTKIIFHYATNSAPARTWAAPVALLAFTLAYRAI